MNNAQYQQVTDRIVGMIEQGTRPWARSWKSDPAAIAAPMQRPLRACGKPYTGANVLNLWAAAAIRGFTSRYWFTFKGAKAAGGNVRKGAKSELAFFVGSHTVADKPDGDASPSDGDAKTISFMRAYHVFNADECEGLPAHFYGAVSEPAPVIAGRMPGVDAFVGRLGVACAHGGDKAYYMPSLDSVRMPHMVQFDKPESYYTTLLHEMMHATGHESRCDRQLVGRFGDDAYAAEELIAELGAAFLCADLTVSAEPREDHASYLAHWLRVLKADNKAIFRAASLAEKGAAWCHDQQPADAADESDDDAGEFALAA